jgi:hypothetical protein
VLGMSLEFAGAPLQLEAKLEYIQRKEQERHARPNSPVGATAGKKRRAEGEPDAGDEGGEGGEDGGKGEGEAAAAGGEAAEGEAAAPEYEPGCILHFDFGEAAEFKEPPTFGLVKDSFGGRRDGGVQFVEYTQVSRGGGRVGARKALKGCFPCSRAEAVVTCKGTLCHLGRTARL